MSNAQTGSGKPGRVYAARLVGLPIYDPQGDQVGKVRDLVVAIRSETSQPRVLGLVVEVLGRRRIFVPMTRVTNIDSGQVYTTGLLNMRRFEQRPTETLVIGQMLDRTVTIEPTGRPRHGLRRRAWSRRAPATGCSAASPCRSRARACAARGQTYVVEWRDVVGLVAPRAHPGCDPPDRRARTRCAPPTRRA